jgi:hypothetical protein
MPRRYLDRLNVEPSVSTLCVLANQWRTRIFSGKLPRPRDTRESFDVIGTDIIILLPVGRDGIVVPSWLALCLIAQGSGFESQRGHLFLGIPQGEISQDGVVQPHIDI